jgi:biopolymer transport protein ExbB
MSDLFGLFSRAGISAYPLGICAILAIGILIERSITLSRLKQLEDRAFAMLHLELESGKTGAISDQSLADAPIVQIANHLKTMQGAGEEDLLAAADIALSLQRLRLRRFLGTLATIGSTAPFIGLFGTVLGVMAAFQAMSKSGLSGETMAAGISEALSATAVGLLVAIPAVMSYNFFTGRVQGMLLQLQGHVARLVPLISAQVSRR